MYPPANTEEYYQPDKKRYPPGPPPSMGILVPGDHQYYSAFHVESEEPGPWSTGLCDCCDDVSNCCVTCFCPCFTFGRIAEIVDRGSSSCGASGALYALILFITGCGWMFSCFYRSKMREQYALPRSPCHDCLVHCCCEPCALCQEYRELESRGFVLRLGWYGNLERQAQGSTAPPAAQSGMTR